MDPYTLSVIFTELNGVSPVLVTLYVYVTLVLFLTIVALGTFVNEMLG